MPTNKDCKRLVRARMRKTGESYTAARAHFLPKKQTPTPTDYTRLAGLSDAAVKAKTGCGWERWVKALDRVAAYTWPHREIAEYVHQKYKVPSWWTQMVTVGYERIKGLRAIGQRRGGGFEATECPVLPGQRHREDLALGPRDPHRLVPRRGPDGAVHTGQLTRSRAPVAGRSGSPRWGRCWRRPRSEGERRMNMGRASPNRAGPFFVGLGGAVRPRVVSYRSAIARP